MNGIKDIPILWYIFMKSGVIYGHKNENTDICIRNQKQKNLLLTKKEKNYVNKKFTHRDFSPSCRTRTS